jgi:hypothetical protein
MSGSTDRDAPDALGHDTGAEGGGAVPTVAVNTLSVLVAVGFCPSTRGMPGTFEYDFGNVTLYALRCTNRWFVEVVLLTGVMRGRNSLSQVQHELRAQEESREAVLAHVAWALDRAADGTQFRPSRPADWLEEGRAHKHLLPWARSQLANQASQERRRVRPHCEVDRKWMRMAVSTLRDFAESAGDGETVSVIFDGRSLAFEAANLRCIVAAIGEPWPDAVSVRAKDLAEFQRRFKYPVVVVGVWEGHLEIGDVRYALAAPAR